MKKIFIYFVIILLSACKSVSFNDLHSHNENVNKLPVLTVKVDKDSLKSAFPSRKITTGSNTTFNNDVSFFGSVSSYEQDSRARDTVSIINYDVKNNITSKTGKIGGKISVRISNVESDYNIAYYPLTALQYITLFIPTALGAPVGEQICSIELEVDIENNNKEIIASYNEVGEGRAKVAAYYGYTHAEALRYCSLLAVHNAMDKIKLNIAEDYNRLNNRLKK